MEIINYVGSNYNSKKNIFSYLRITHNRTSRKSRRLSPVTGLSGQAVLPNRMYMPTSSYTPSVFSIRGTLRYIGAIIDVCLQSYKRNWYRITVTILSACTAVFVYGLCMYFYNFATPVALKDIPVQELEILNGIMQQFALDSIGKFDAEGNILNEDGTLLQASEYSFNQPVSYKTYTVVSGDTLLGITLKFGLTNISTLIAVNNIDNVRQLRSGQKLTIPSVDGLTYTVRSGDTMQGLSSRYNIAMEDILDVNDLDTKELQVGQKLFIPGAKLSAERIRQAMGEQFIYPIASGWRLTSRFGPRLDPITGAKSRHTGIDMAAPKGTPIKAAMGGKVIVAGFSNVFGNYVIINHGNGYQSLYGHMSKILVKKGQSVGQGERVGAVGSTGYSTGNHLHFTVYKNGQLIDPLSVLK